jgi:hypothetical protein
MTENTHPLVRAFVDELSTALGEHLVSVALYGSAARGDFVNKVSDFNLLVVVDDVTLATLERLTIPFAHWRGRRQPAPRVFSVAMLESSADVFPIEFHEIIQRHIVLAGRDLFAAIRVDDAYLRLQCERELREKLLRLEEAYIEAQERSKDVARVMMESYSAFAAIFRGCLTLLGGEPPLATHDVVLAFCARAGLEASVFDRVEQLRKGERIDQSHRALFERYHLQLVAAVSRVDRFSGAPRDARVSD